MAIRRLNRIRLYAKKFGVEIDVGETSEISQFTLVRKNQKKRDDEMLMMRAYHDKLIQVLSMDSFLNTPVCQLIQKQSSVMRDRAMQ